jgi:Nif-specific regulatory protein
MALYARASMSLGAVLPESLGRRPERDRPLAVMLPDPLATLGYAIEALTSGPTLAEGFERAMGHLDERLGAKHAVLFLGNGRERTLTLEAAYGAATDDFRPRYGLGVAGRVAEGGRPIVVPAVRQDPMALSELADLGRWRSDALSLVTVPVARGGRSLGALSVYFASDAASGFATRLGLLQVVASVLGQRLHGLHVGGAASGDPGDAHSDERTASSPGKSGAQGGGRSEPGVFEYANLIGTSAAMRQVYEEIGQVAGTTATALILGESGTGKELVAQAIHSNSERARKPFVKLNGAAFPETLFESELFGHERGAFTGAVSRKKGRLDLAQGGTLFLDEIGELPLSTQVKLLRVLQFREFERLGGTETLKADVRLVAATNKNMEQAVEAGVFREDLYYRLNVFTIALPPLRERRTDVPALAEYFLEKYATDHRRRARRIASSALDVLCQHGWPGNVRELENAVERAVVACDGSVVEERHLPKTLRAKVRAAPDRKLSLAEAVEALERRMIEEALGETLGNLARAARALGTTERILGYKIGKYKLAPSREGSKKA